MVLRDGDGGLNVAATGRAVGSAAREEEREGETRFGVRVHFVLGGIPRVAFRLVAKLTPWPDGALADF